MKLIRLNESVTSILALLFASNIATAQVCPANDAYEPDSDYCITAPALPVGSTTDLNIRYSADLDLYSYTMASNETLTVDALFSHAVGDLNISLWHTPFCSSPMLLVASSSQSDNEQLSYTNTGPAPLPVVLLVDSISLTMCTDYELHVGPSIAPCSTVAEDANEPNDSCAQAIALAPGLHTGLAVFKGTSDDFWAVDVPDGHNLTVWVLSSVATGQNVDCYLYDSSTLGSTCGDHSNFLASGSSVSDDETMWKANATGSTQIYYIQVNVWDDASVLDCGEYDLSISVQPTVPIGTPLCFGDGSSGDCPCGNESAVGAGEGCQSSLGLGSILTASGTLSVALDNLAFTVTQVRPNQPGMLVQGAAAIQQPFKDGILCTGTPTERVEFVFTDGTGTATTVSSIVTGGNVAPGDVRWYQVWSRDPGGVSPCATGSNFSNALEVTYTP